jgi:hypothetical protein
MTYIRNRSGRLASYVPTGMLMSFCTLNTSTTLLSLYLYTLVAPSHPLSQWENVHTSQSQVITKRDSTRTSNHHHGFQCLGRAHSRPRSRA